MIQPDLYHALRDAAARVVDCFLVGPDTHAPPGDYLDEPGWIVSTADAEDVAAFNALRRALDAILVAEQTP